ncbi:YlxR family protein [Janibacter hoylei]|uniref:YlxR family protein n=1 Tax=Janibacter hoylei TaxID=364298 RepID=UPI0027B98EB4|nr:YlxR family protein [Janibacter hoylei]
MEFDRTGLQSDDVAAGPIRTCIGCRGRDSRSTLLRIVAVTDDRGETSAQPDPRRRLPGRGAWLHPDIACLDLAVRRRALSRALRCRVEVTDALRAWIEEMAQSTASVRTATESGFDADEHPMSTQQ